MLLVYASLYPFTGWRAPLEPVLWTLVLAPWPAHVSSTDILTNALAYVPLGLCLAGGFRATRPSAQAVLLATLAGALLSFGIEFVQRFLPERVASAADIALNTAGAGFGAALVLLVRTDGRGRPRLVAWRDERLAGGPEGSLALVTLLLWVLAQVAPLVPSFDIGNLRQGLAPLRAFLQRPASFDTTQWIVWTLQVAGLAGTMRSCSRPGAPVLRAFFLVVVATLLYKVPAVTRQLSAEAIAGAGSAAFVALLLAQLGPRSLRLTSAVLIAVAFIVTELAPGTGSRTQPFVWLPFRAHMENTLIGIRAVLETLWPAAALALLAVQVPQRHRHAIGLAGGIALAASVFALEWRQQRIPGRVGDFTTVLMMTATWCLVWLAALRPRERASHPAARP
jgi:VanZ family protein